MIIVAQLELVQREMRYGWHISVVVLRYCQAERQHTVESNAQSRERISELARINESQRCKMFRIHKILNCRTSKGGLL